MSLSTVSFLKILGIRQRSEIFQRGMRNASFSIGEYIVTPLLYIFSTPFLVHQLGLNQYGIWMLANSIVGFIGILNFGLSEATVKYVSLYRGREDEGGVVRCIRSTLTMYLGLSMAMVIVGCVLAPFLVHRIFKISPQDFTVSIRAIQLASIGLGLRIVGSVFLAAMRGFERYDLTSKINIGSTTLMVTSSVVLAAFGYGVTTILLSTVIVVGLTLVASIIVAKRLIGKFSMWPTFDRTLLREVLNFGFFSWIQGLAATIFSQVDRLIIGALLGTSALSYYSITLQVAQQTHGLVGSALAFLFPMISSERETRNRVGLRNLYKKALLFSFIFAATIAIPLLIGGKFLLTVWMGANFAANTYVLLYILVIAYFLLALNVVPHYTLLGFGEVKFVSLTNIAGGLLSLAGMAFLIPFVGMNGAALGRLLYAPIVTFNFLRIRGKL
ncbi:MAG: putative membrane protein EpsK [Actinobacteria bacterium]|nr:putative membrane protein EpsK [Actinomycetota bacterium]